MAGNLYTPAAGLLETHVTWTDVQEAIQEAFGEHAILGPNKSLTKIGEGNGFLSNVAIVSPDWQTDDTEKLPTKFVLKLCTCVNIVRLADTIRERSGAIESEEKIKTDYQHFADLTKHLHNTEVYAYDLFKKYIKPTESLSILTPYFQRKFSEENPLKGFLSFDFVENVYPRHCYHKIEPSDLSEVLRTVAKLQVISLRTTPVERKHMPNIVPRMYSSALRKEKLDEIFQSFSSLVREEYRHVIQEIKQYADELTDLSKLVTITDELGMDPVFVHGDLWASNVMWKKTENGIEFLKLIDYQVAHFGCAAEDFIRIFCSSLSGQDFMNCWESLLEEFYTYFMEELGTQKAPYTLEQLKESYERLLPQSLIVLLLIIQPIAEAGCKNNKDGEDSLEVLQDKIEAALTSMLKSLKKFYKH
ncbi:unnamed protein product [Auanema sp. JU1783]|nr:unnamed protein product [Auanema sp. JU1783]